MMSYSCEVTHQASTAAIHMCPATGVAPSHHACLLPVSQCILSYYLINLAQWTHIHPQILYTTAGAPRHHSGMLPVSAYYVRLMHGEHNAKYAQ